MNRGIRWISIALAVILLSDCAGSTAGLGMRIGANPELCCRRQGGPPVRAEYLGSGGWLLESGKTSILTAPFFSNPSLLRVVFFRLQSNVSVVARQLAQTDLHNVHAVLAGHSHYDHLLDLPAVFVRLPDDATLYSGQTTVNLLAPVLGGRVASILDFAGTFTRTGHWITVGRVRFMPIVSEHAAHVGGVKFFFGHSTSPRADAPKYAREWLEGESLAFLIDFLDDDGKIDFRFYYDDAAHSWPYGFPDAATLQEHSVDVAIVCAASSQSASGYPEMLIGYLKPRYVLVGHWEDFFTSSEAAPRTVRLTDVREFLRRLDSALPGGARSRAILDRHASIQFISTQ